MNTTSVKTSLDDLYELWGRLGDVPTYPDGELVDCIEIDFHVFSAGTHREEIWHWFEEQNPDFIVGEVLQGIRRESSVS